MTLDIYQVDAFTDTLFKGNPAAVVPLKTWLPDAVMQQIAMENNVAETAFFVPLYPGIKGDGADYHIRWFTPAVEIDLCGHATVATAFIISKILETEETEMVFSTQTAGQLVVEVKDDWLLLNFPARMPQQVAVPELLYKALGNAKPVAVLKSRDYFVVLENEEAVKNLKPDFALLKQLDGTGVIVTAPGEAADAVSRCFFPKAGIDEDPVTGSAHCSIVPYWSKELNKSKLVCFQASARGGELVCEHRGERVILGGKAVLYLKGEIYLEDQAL